MAKKETTKNTATSTTSTKKAKTSKAVETAKEIDVAIEDQVTPEDRRDLLVDTILTQIEEYNSLSKGKFLEDAMKKALEIDATQKDLENACKVVSFSRHAKAEIPLASAAKSFCYNSYKIKNSVDKITGVPKKELVKAKPIINVHEFDDFCDGQSGVNSEWKGKMERLHCALLIRRGVERGKTVDEVESMRENYAMRKVARQYTQFNEIEKVDEAEIGNPISNGSLKKALQEIINDMIGESPKHTIKTQDVLFMMDCYAKEGKGRKDIIVCARLDYARILFKICSKLEYYGPTVAYDDVCDDLK